MTITVAGTLLNPIGQVSAGTEIKVTAKQTIGATLKDLQGKVVTGENGAYSFELVEGTHLIEISFSNEYLLAGEVVINGSTPSPLTLPALLNR